MKSFHRGISRFNLYAIFINVILLVSITLCSCPGTATYPSSEEITTQRIDYFMQSVLTDGNSVVNYTKFLNAGDNVSGYVELIGEWELSGDWRTEWYFNALSPSGEVLDYAIILYDMDPYYYFNFTASTQGVYTIQVIHISCFPQDLRIEIQPSGWELSGN